MLLGSFGLFIELLIISKMIMFHMLWAICIFLAFSIYKIMLIHIALYWNVKKLKK